MLIAIMASVFVPFVQTAQAVIPVTDVAHIHVSVWSRIATHIEAALGLGVNSTTATATTTGTALKAFDLSQKGLSIQKLAIDQPFTLSACNTLEGSGFFVDLLDNFGNALASTGDQTKTTGTLFITQKLTRLKAAKICWDSFYTASERVFVGMDRPDASLIAKRQNYITAQKALEARIQDLVKQQAASLKDVFKALSVSIILDLNKNLTTKLVNELKDKYKIGKYLDYADALASQVYAVDYIKKNYNGDQQNQLILTTLAKAQNIPGPLSNNLYYKTAQSVIEAKVAKTCPNVGTLGGWQSSNWYQSVNSAASDACNVRLEQEKAQQQLQAVMSGAKQSADQEIKSSNGGFKSTRNCTDASAQNKKIDAQYVAHDTALAKAKAAVDLAGAQIDKLYQDVNDPNFEANLKVALDSFDKAKAAYATALKSYEALPDQVAGGVVTLCEAISSPANFLAQGINSYLTKHLDQTFKLQSDNLPLFGKILSKYTSNFVTNILLGNKSNGHVLNDTKGFVGAALGATAAAAIENVGNGGSGGGTVLVYPPKDLGPCTVAGSATAGRSFELSWNLTGVDKGKSVVITPQANKPVEALQGKANVCITSLTTYQFKIYDTLTPTSSTKPLDDQSLEVDPARYSYNGSTSPRVAGAQTLLPRGPQSNLR